MSASANKTSLLPPGLQENVLTLRYGPAFLDELRGFTRNKFVYDVIVVDAQSSGFTFQADVLLEAVHAASKLLALQGCMIIAAINRTFVLLKQTLRGDLTVQAFDSAAELYDYSPAIAVHAQGVWGLEKTLGSTDLSQQVFLATVPVLTAFGIKLKANMESAPRRNRVLGATDSYTPISGIIQRITTSGQFVADEVIEEIRLLEQAKAIFPVFARIPYLVHSYRNQMAIELSDYLLAAELVTAEILEELALEQKSIHPSSRLQLGPLCVSKGIISTRALEIILQDMAFYGQANELSPATLSASTSEPRSVQSLVGHLGTTDPAGLLQSLSSNRESGVLSVEHRDLQFRAFFEKGRLSFAKLGKIKGNLAIIELVSVWREGVFVFIQRDPPADLADQLCQVSKPLDKLLLDSALANDNIEVVWKKLSNGANSLLEKLPDTNNIWKAPQLLDPIEKTPLPPAAVSLMKTIWDNCNGLTSAATIIYNIGEVTTSEAAAAIDRLLAYQLITVPAMDVSIPLEKFRKITEGVGEQLGMERNLALLKLSLQSTQGYSVKARMFTIGPAAEVGLDLAAAQSSGSSLSSILKELEDWQVKYIEYVSQELDKNILRDIVYKVHQQS